MSTRAQIANDRLVHRAIVVTAGLLAVSILALGGLFARDQFMRSGAGQLDQQLQQAKDQVQSDPENLSARIQLANAYSAKGMYPEALEQFREALKKDGNNQDLLLAAGVAAVRGKQDDEAIQYLQRVADLNKDADFVQGNRQLNAVYYELGRIYLSKGQTAKAVENLKQALNIDSTDSDALLLMGNALAAQGDLDKAFAMYQNAVAYVPDFTDAYLAMAQVADKKGDSAKAAYARAMVAFSNGNMDEAIAGLEAVAPRLPSDFADVWFGLGMAYEKKGEKAKALAAYQKTVQINPKHFIARSDVERLSKQ